MINNIFSYKGYNYKVLNTGIMKTGVWKKLPIFRFWWSFKGMKWVDCVIYESVSSKKIFVRDLKEFTKKFKEVEAGTSETAITEVSSINGKTEYNGSDR